MQLSAEAFQQFARIQSALNNFIYAQLQQAAGKPAVTPFRDLPFDKQMEVRAAFVANPEYVERFVAENPQNLSSDDLQIALGWRKPVSGSFYLVRHLKKYSVFLTAGNMPTAYGVLGLTQPIAEVLANLPLPIMAEAVLLPFGDKIVFDGLLNAFSVTFGPGLRKSLTEEYNDAKDRCGIVTSLPTGDDEPEVVAETTKPKRKKSAAPTKRAPKKSAATKMSASHE